MKIWLRAAVRGIEVQVETEDFNEPDRVDPADTKIAVGIAMCALNAAVEEVVTTTSGPAPEYPLVQTLEREAAV